MSDNITARRTFGPVLQFYFYYDRHVCVVLWHFVALWCRYSHGKPIVGFLLFFLVYVAFIV